MKFPLPHVCSFLLGGMILLAGPAQSADFSSPADRMLVVDQSFDSIDLDSKWHINTGKWEPQDGVLRVNEVEADHHSAAARYPVETKNAVYQFRFRFVDRAEAFHFGFDPAPGQLDKRGHLFSVIVTPTSWKVMKHVDKGRPKEDPNEVLAQQKSSFDNEQWYTLRVTTRGTHVTASIEGKETLQATHPTFAVKKPTLVFRCIGDGVELDDIKVWKQVE